MHQIIRSHSNGIPLGAQADLNKFKLMIHDIGLNQAMLGLELKEWFLEPTLAFVNKGSISESYIGQELLAYSNPQNKQDLYYWHREQRGSNAEIDYLITHGQSVIPVEVKSGHGGGLQSMRLFLETNKSSSYGIRFSINNYSVFDQIHSYPLYAVAGAMDDKQRLIKFLE